MRMVKMADINKRLLTASDGIPAPQHKVKGASDFEFTEGSGGAQHTKIVDSSGQPISIDEELKSIKRTQAEILDRLDNGIDTRVTGSNVEEIIIERQLFQGDISNRDGYVDVPRNAKGCVVVLRVHGAVGDFSEGKGLRCKLYQVSRDFVSSVQTWHKSWETVNDEAAVMFYMYPGINLSETDIV